MLVRTKDDQGWLKLCDYCFQPAPLFRGGDAADICDKCFRKTHNQTVFIKHLGLRLKGYEERLAKAEEAIKELKAKDEPIAHMGETPLYASKEAAALAAAKAEMLKESENRKEKVVAEAKARSREREKA